MGCSSCKFLNENNKKEGAVNGCIHYCSKMKNYVNGSSNPCNKFEKDYSRKTYINDTIYKNGKSYYNDPTPIGAYIFILITLIIVAIIIKLTNIY